MSALPTCVSDGGVFVVGVLYNVFERREPPYINKKGEHMPESYHWCAEIRSVLTNEHGLDVQSLNYVYLTKSQIQAKAQDTLKTLIGTVVRFYVMAGSMNKLIMLSPKSLPLTNKPLE